MNWKEEELFYINKMEKCMKNAMEDPMWILSNFSEFPFGRVSPMLTKVASQIICQQLDTVKGFEGVDIHYNPDGIFKVCPIDSKTPLAIINLHKKTVSVAQVREIPDTSSEKNKKRLMEVEKELNRSRSFKNKLYFAIAEKEILQAEKEALEANIAVVENKKRKANKDKNAALAEINKIRNEVVPVFVKCGYKVL